MREWIKTLLISKELTLLDREEFRKVLLLLNLLILGGAGAYTALAFSGQVQSNFLINAGLFIVLALLLTNLVLLWQRRGFTFSQLTLPGLIWAFATLAIGSSNGVHDAATMRFSIAIAVAGITLGAVGQILFGILSGVSLLGIAYAEMNGLLQTPFSALTTAEDLRTIAIVTIILTATQYLITQVLLSQLQKNAESQKRQAETNQELLMVRASLEEQVEQRTHEILQRAEELNQKTLELQRNQTSLEKRTEQLQAIAAISQTIGRFQTLKELLPQISQTVSARLGFYHTGIFLLDSTNQYAILAAANSEGGQKMLARGHRLQVGAQGIVGYVTKTGNPRIALDVGEDASFFNNPDLPETHSEAALPLSANGVIIGALDVQSEQTNAFSQEDVQVLGILAEQISIAIDNARLYENSQKSLSEVETIYRQYLRREWNKLTRNKKILGFQYGISGAKPLSQKVQTEQMTKALQTEQAASQAGQEAELAIPIKVRQTTIGAVSIRLPNKEVWKQEDIDVAQAIAERIAISAENARLFEETTNRAEREQAVSQITSKIRSTNNPEEMIEIALRELRQTLGATKAQILPFHPEEKHKK